MILGFLFVLQTLGPDLGTRHELVWTRDPATGAGGFGAFWFDWVVRPVFAVLLFAWLWRLVLVFVLFARISRLRLSLIPTHPDGAAGLGFLEKLPTAFSPVVFGISAVLASRWAHDVLYHEVHVASLRLPMIAFVVVALLLFLTPLLPWMRVLAAAKRNALLEYGALVGRHGGLVRRRWILGEAVTDETLLDAPEIGPVADTIPLYEAVRKMRPLPVGRSALLAIALPAALPLIPVIAIEVPVKDILLKLVTTLV
jgi:hypothetical protein